MSNAVTSPDHELEFVRNFVTSDRRDRLIQLLSAKNSRKKFLAVLGHFSDFDNRCIIEIFNDDQHAAAILKILRDNGAPKLCYVISENLKFDQKNMELTEAVANTIGMGFGTIVSCLPGRLAFYEGEYQRRVILKKYP